MSTEHMNVGIVSRSLSNEQVEELKRLKQYFPFRHVFGVIKTDGTFEAHCQTTMRRANKLSRAGHAVYLLQ
jgi:hypothetical protein